MTSKCKCPSANSLNTHDRVMASDLIVSLVMVNKCVNFERDSCTRVGKKGENFIKQEAHKGLCSTGMFFYGEHAHTSNRQFTYKGKKRPKTLFQIYCTNGYQISSKHHQCSVHKLNFMNFDHFKGHNPVMHRRIQLVFERN